MMWGGTNPYHPPHLSEEPTRRPTRWRVVPATLFGVTGIAVFAFGLFAAIMCVRSVGSEPWAAPPGLVIGMVIGCCMYFAIGLAFMLAGWWYWRGRYRAGVIASLAGVTLPLVAAAVMFVRLLLFEP